MLFSVALTKLMPRGGADDDIWRQKHALMPPLVEIVSKGIMTEWIIGDRPRALSLVRGKLVPYDLIVGPKSPLSVMLEHSEHAG